MRVPIIRLGRILLISIQTDLTDNDALCLQSDLIKKISDTEAQGVAIDITALDVVDSYMARIINDTVCMAQLLGADVVISGVQPFVALSMVEMGSDLIRAECVFNLEQAMKRLEIRMSTRGDICLKRDNYVQ